MPSLSSAYEYLENRLSEHYVGLNAAKKQKNKTTQGRLGLFKVESMIYENIVPKNW